MYINSPSLPRFKVCPNKPPKQVLLSYQNTAGPFTTLSGNVRFIKRLDNVVQCRVNKINISSPSGVTLTGGYAFYLASSKLSSLIGQNPFVMATGVNSSDLLAYEVSTVVGLGDLSQLTLVTNGDTSSRLEHINPIMNFLAPSPVESFDWQIGLCNGSLTLTAAYTVEIEIEFYQSCECY